MLCGAESQRWRKDGAIRARYPTDHYMEPGRSGYIPDYQLEWILMMHEYFMYYGSDELIQSLYPNLKKLLEYFRPFVILSLAYWPTCQAGLFWIIRIPYPMDQKKVITGLNCLYYGAFERKQQVLPPIRPRIPIRPKYGKNRRSNSKEILINGFGLKRPGLPR